MCTRILVARDGNPCSTHALKHAANLLVLGTHGCKGRERWLLGSVAEGVARRSTVPALLAPLPG